MELCLPPIIYESLLSSSSKIEYSDIPCLKCEGSGINLKGKTCRECDGKGMMRSDRKLKTIEYLLEQKLLALNREIEGLKWKKLELSEKEDFNKRSIQINRDLAFENQFVHQGFVCDRCSINPIVGIRFHCLICLDFDLCDLCEKTFGPVHGHPLLKIKGRFSENLDERKNFLNIGSLQQINDYRANIDVLNFKTNDLGANIVEIERNNEFRAELKITNNGEQRWPNGVEFKCISGVFENIGEGVPSLEPKEDYKVLL
jgi:Zinc finger, ZZ type